MLPQTVAALVVTVGGNVSEPVDAVINGAGVMGAMNAWRLALRGRSVVLVEQSGGTGPLGFGAYGLESPGEGVKVGIESTIRTIRVVTPHTRTYEEGPVVTEAAREYAALWLPGTDTSRHTSVTCLFTETADSHFVLERHGPIVNCSPCSGHGFKFAPAIGDRAARLAPGDASVPPLPYEVPEPNFYRGIGSCWRSVRRSVQRIDVTVHVRLIC